MVGQNAEPSEVLAALFNNTAFADVSTAAHRLLGTGSESTPITTRMVASTTGRGDSVVRPVIHRLIRAGLLEDREPVHPRAPRYLHRTRPERWAALIGLIAEANGVPADLFEGVEGQR